MNEQGNGQLRAPNRTDGPAEQQSSVQAPSHGKAEQPRFTVDKPNIKNNEAVAGPFTVRDLTVFGSVLVLFVASLIPMFAVRYNLWNLGSLFFLGLGILLPLIVAALFVARRVSPGTRLRVGSLSVDQFGSVVASFSVAFFFLAAAGAFVPSMLLGLIGALGLFTATVLGRLIPALAGDFLHRAEAPAHVVAREAAAPVRRPRAPKAAKPAAEGSASKPGAALAGWAKRITPSGGAAASTASEPTPRGYEAHDAARVARPSAEPATQAHGVVAPAAGQPEAVHTPAAPAAPAADAATAAHPAPTATAAAASAPAGSGASAAAESAAPAGKPADAAPASEQTQAAAAPVPPAGHDAPTALTPQVRQQEPIGATVDPASRPEQGSTQPAYEAFWFAVAQPRTAVDERTGTPSFVVEPGGWVLALEDRGHEFLVQHTDGRVGVLRDLSNIERG
ncbi:hypothetical protein [Arthrobacter sp. NPDC057259]|uniref:hypothetical protein n=1 Tax=Arthrobacter sp. NPDC057259 TaxID=3346073 RepID=UPI0036286FCC